MLASAVASSAPLELEDHGSGGLFSFRLAPGGGGHHPTDWDLPAAASLAYEGRSERTSVTMWCSVRAMALTSLAFGLVATGTLSLAVSVDYWLFTSEPVQFTVNVSTVIIMANFHSGLWRACPYYEFDLGEEEQVPACTNINYFQSWARIEEADTTNSILRALRKSSPVVVLSLLVLITALGFATSGNHRRDARTLVGAVLYIFAALGLATGVIFYISAVNDEVAHRKKPESKDDPQFSYRYGWAFFFAGSSFMCAMMAAVANISLYIKRTRAAAKKENDLESIPIA